MQPSRFPHGGSVALAAVTTITMLVAGVNIWLCAAVLVLWFASLWLAMPEPEAPAPRLDVEAVSRDAVSDTIEPLGTPLLILEASRIVMANRAARAALGEHILGQDARIALRHPEAMRLLDGQGCESVTISGFTGSRSLWQLTRRRIDDQRCLIELQDRTAEADVSRAHTDFVANASHELRTPLAAVIGYVEILLDSGDAIDPATAQRFHETVLREAKRMDALVSDLMSLSQVEAEKHDSPVDPVDLASLAARVAGEAAAIAGKDRLEVSAEEKTLEIPGDRTQLEQLVRNLVDNALKYGDPDKPVRIAVSRDERGRIVLRVTDHGPGIAAEHLPHLTRRFYRTDPGRSKAAGGTGLGLAIVKHIVERHRGLLDITSEQGVGTQVTVTFEAIGPAA